MHQRGQQRQLPPSPSRTSAHSTRHRPSQGALLAVIGLLGVAVAGAAGCGDKDTTDVTPNGGTGGSAGSAGSAGRGGTAGTAGTAGTGGSAGTAGAAGTAGTAGTGGSTGEDPDAGTDAGTDPDSGDGGDDPPGPDPERLARAEAMCAAEEALPDCQSPPENCVDNFLTAQSVLDFFPQCSDEIFGYYDCMSGAGDDAFVCRDETGPDTKYAALSEDTPCPDEEAAWLDAQGGQGCDD